MKENNEGLGIFYLLSNNRNTGNENINLQHLESVMESIIYLLQYCSNLTCRNIHCVFCAGELLAEK